jgi:hypothetical protein
VAFARRAGPDLAVCLLGDLEVHHQVDCAVCLEVEVEHERSIVEHVRRGFRANPCGAVHAVTSDQREAIGARVGCWTLLLRHDSAQLEHGLEVRVEAQLEREPHRLSVVAAHGDPLAQRALGVGRELHA